MQVRTPGAHYDAKTIRLHWLTAGLVIFLWCLGQTIDWFPKGNGRVFARSAHISAGALLGVVLVLRIWWRATGGARLAAVGSGGVNALSTAMHLALYGGLITAVALGLANTWVRGDNLFNLVHIPAFDPGNKVLRAGRRGLPRLRRRPLADPRRAARRCRPRASLHPQGRHPGAHAAVAAPAWRVAPDLTFAAPINDTGPGAMGIAAGPVM